ncbi:hypothetical protein C8A03DRAFT_13416 [Achaetomium macrosporum]|uniref:Uncharacterized protein n=1 Tax=Achaetomium macrosporum TaxID=79813 RepID=A0AAN7CE24_9PEZI|nr:hypothetical protein C8A03DRAFT_13416 [Achaetomium macrosporum]
MASTRTSIPRFLLPQSGLIWRRAAPSPSGSASASRRILLRLASSSSSSSTPSNPSGPRVLAKPERFNPPSHGSRLPKKTPPRHYGGDLSFEEAAAQAQRDYPGMPPPPNTRAYWFIHNRWIHVFITVGTLSGLAIFTFAMNFKHTSPFADMLPPASDYLYHPISSVRMLIEVLRLHEAHKTAQINEKRKRNVEDVAKRAAYRKAHGLPDEMGLFNQPMARIKTDEEMAAERGQAGNGVQQQQRQGGEQKLEESGEAAVAAAGTQKIGPEVRRLTEEERQAVVKEAKQKWLGIF